jgi:hypothetical protein
MIYVEIYVPVYANSFLTVSEARVSVTEIDASLSGRTLSKFECWICPECRSLLPLQGLSCAIFHNTVYCSYSSANRQGMQSPCVKT